jgi:hypothetical protein
MWTGSAALWNHSGRFVAATSWALPHGIHAWPAPESDLVACTQKLRKESAEGMMMGHQAEPAGESACRAAAAPQPTKSPQRLRHAYPDIGRCNVLASWSLSKGLSWPWCAGTGIHHTVICILKPC